MKSFPKYVLAGLCTSALLVLSATTAQAQVLAHSGDVAGSVGYLHVSTSAVNLPSDNHPIYKIDGGYNVTPYVTVLGEWAYGPLYSMSGETVHTQIFGGGARINLMPHKRLVPYAVFTVGDDRDTLTAEPTFSGYYFGVGGGASYFIGKHWGVRPEFRYTYAEFNIFGANDSANAVTIKGGAFYQFGGRGGSKP